MIALRGLLYSVFTLVLTTIISLLVVGIIALIYRLVRRNESPKEAVK